MIDKALMIIIFMYTLSFSILGVQYSVGDTFGITLTNLAAFVAWELITLMTGTYIFYIMYLFGVPLIFVLGMTILYGFLLARAIIGYVRGI